MVESEIRLDALDVSLNNTVDSRQDFTALLCVRNIIAQIPIARRRPMF